MCENCGCTGSQPVSKTESTELHQHSHHHSHSHGHDHEHFHDHMHDDDHGHYHDHGDGHFHFHSEAEISAMEARKQNQLQADRNRGMFEAKSIFAVKITSSQGSGKSAVIGKSVELMKDTFNLFVIEENQEICKGGCRFDAEKVFKTVKSQEVTDKSVLFIENLSEVRTDGSADLGEIRRVVIFGVTEGDNKPAKYPELFTAADVCIINKIDLLPYVDFNIAKAKNTILALNPGIKFFEVSSKTGDGFGQWVKWISEECRKISE